MKFEENNFYHVFNQGNNRRQVFYSEADYEHFLYKLKSYITPFADIIAYCLMPNHFHILLYVKKAAIERVEYVNEVEMIQNEYIKKLKIKPRARALRVNKRNPSKMSLEQAIGIIQRSYTRYKNVKKAWSGSMFRNNFKIKDDWKHHFITVNNDRFTNDLLYVGRCIFYIHQNPVVGNLCSHPLGWKYSSAREYEGYEGYGICQLEVLNSI
jgi:putative transposase